MASSRREPFTRRSEGSRSQPRSQTDELKTQKAPTWLLRSCRRSVSRRPRWPDSLWSIVRRIYLPEPQPPHTSSFPTERFRSPDVYTNTISLAVIFDRVVRRDRLLDHRLDLRERLLVAVNHQGALPVGRSCGTGDQFVLRPVRRHRGLAGFFLIRDDLPSRGHSRQHPCPAPLQR